jgi:hypothetical protein
MSRIKYYLTCAKPLLIFLPLLAAGFIFGLFYHVYNVILLFLIFSCFHNLFNKKIKFQNMLIVDISLAVISLALLYICGLLNITLYASTEIRGILILVCLNQLFMYSRKNYKERIAVRIRYF